MAAKGVTLSNKLLDFLYRGFAMVIGSATATWSSNPPELFVALGTAESDNSFTELPSSGSYARAKLCAGTYQASTDFTATQGGTTGASSGTGQQTANAIVVTFPTATADWISAATIADFAIFDALTSGNMLYFGTLTTARAVTNGTTAQLAIGSLTISET